MRKDFDAPELVGMLFAVVFALPVLGMFTSLIALDLTRSLQVHVATAAFVPAIAVVWLARRFGLSGGVTLRFALLAAMFAMILLDAGWSGLPGH